MPRLPMVGTPLLRIGSCALALGLLALASCATSSGASPQATATATLIPIPPTATPMTLAVRAQDVGGAKVAGVVPGPHGLLLIPLATSPTSSTPSSGQSYATSISLLQPHDASADEGRDGAGGARRLSRGGAQRHLRWRLDLL